MHQCDDMLAAVASLCYILNQSQGEIAARLEISSSKVSRLIKEAREKGIVEIRGRMPIPRDMELEQELLERVSAGPSIGAAWGTGVHATVSALPDHYTQYITVEDRRQICNRCSIE